MPLAADRRRFLLWKSLGTVLQYLPVQFAVRVAQIAGWLVALRATPTRSVAEDNLRTVLESDSDAAIDEKVLRRWLPAMDAGIAHGRIMFVEGEEIIRAAVAKGKGVIVALPHIGSWEWGGALVARLGFPMTAIAEELEPPELFQWFVDQRQAVGLIIEPLDHNAAKRISQTLRAGGLVGLLCDRDIVGDGITADLLGRSTSIPAGPAMLALRTDAELIAGVVYSGPGNQHCVHIVGPIDTERQANLRSDVMRVTQNLADTLSDLIRRTPEQWHVFVPAFRDTAGKK
jgi:phosphatidylinositol dimannoside acyltransferase